MKLEKMNVSFITHVQQSFCKFKLLQMIFPNQKKDLIWIFKNLLTLEGQKLYSDTYDMMLDINYERCQWYVHQIDPLEVIPVRDRLLKYFNNNDPQEWLPLRVFPPILFKKVRYDLSFLPLKEEYDLKEVRESFFKYIMGLNVKEIFIPPPDILYKVGNQLYNDSGVPKKDFEKATNHRSGFLYQYFLAQPLSPREVWLPDKFIKHNNLFWMIIGRQLLKQSPVYPSSDITETWMRIRHLLEEGCLRFDISGFGFQFPRKLLSLMASVIEELYPTSHMISMAKDFDEILDSVKVEHRFEVHYPPRGIGLGYYEDIKTLVMLAILDKYNPISVYGDQGILRPFCYEAIMDLQKHDFILKDDKVEYQSYDTFGGMKWGGAGMFPHMLKRTKDYSNPLIGAMFSQFHWERKASLQSLYEEDKMFYYMNLKKLCRFSNQIFGYEFFDGDLDLPFNLGGINPMGSDLYGVSSIFYISEFLKPYEDTLFEVPYLSPFHRGKQKAYPRGIARQFQKDRKACYHRPPISSDVYFYHRPRVTYTRQYKPKDKILPDWADLIFLCEYGSTTGNFFYGLDQEKLYSIFSQYNIVEDPLRAGARGGFKIIDYNYSRHQPVSREWLAVLDFLSNLDRRHLPYCPRVDVGLPPPIFGSDELYFSTNLYKSVEKNIPLKRKRSVAFSESSLYEKVKGVVKENILNSIHNGVITNLCDIVPVIENNMIDHGGDYLQDYEDFYSSVPSEEVPEELL